jgi:Siphovirus Gp157
MAKIYELTQQQSEILDRLFWLDENDEEDIQEIEKLKIDLYKIHASAERTLEYLVPILLETRALLAGREEAKRRAERRRKTAETAERRLVGVIEYIMQKFDIRKLSTEYADISLQMSPGSVAFEDNIDWDLLPEDCYKIEYKGISSAIKEHLKNGDVLPGVWIEKKEGLRVR